ncbi:MAG TPA: hypothetical protein P5328_02110 [Candidatus Paceibacterota bacterium]|nr:hypothetical protein [Candidatus Paceibacterota bacterium]HRZ34454.1 hypothetical protein [Candidatus Paceibacterota bacterium]
MKQMEAPAVPIKAKMRFDQLAGNFFKKLAGGNGEIFFANRFGGMNFGFAVLEDGSVSKLWKGDNQPSPDEEVGMIDPKDLNIAAVRWSDS